MFVPAERSSSSWISRSGSAFESAPSSSTSTWSGTGSPRCRASSPASSSATSALRPWPAPSSFTTYSPSSSASTSAGSDPPSRRGVTYRVAVTVRSIAASVGPACVAGLCAAGLGDIVERATIADRSRTFHGRHHPRRAGPQPDGRHHDHRPPDRQARRIEIVLHNIGGRLVISGMPSPRTRAWIHNLEADPRARRSTSSAALHADLAATARVVTDPAERRAAPRRRREGLGPDRRRRMVEQSPLIELTIPGYAAAGLTPARGHG